MSQHPLVDCAFVVTEDWQNDQGLCRVSRGDVGQIREVDSARPLVFSVRVPHHRDRIAISRRICRLKHEDDSRRFTVDADASNPSNPADFITKGEEGRILQHKQDDFPYTVEVEIMRRGRAITMTVPKKHLKLWTSQAHPHDTHTFRCVQDWTADGGQKLLHGTEGIINRHTPNGNEVEVTPVKSHHTIKVPKGVIQVIHRDDGFPYVAKSTWKNTNGDVVLQKDDAGEILAHDPGDEGWRTGNFRGYVQVSIPHRQENPVWVPILYLEIGRVRRYGDWLLETSLAPRASRFSVNLDAGLTSYDGRLYKIAVEFFHHLKQHIATLPLARDALEDVLGMPGDNESGVFNLAKILARGVEKAKLKDVFENPRFTRQDILKRARVVEPTSATSKQFGSVYMIDISKFRDNPGALPQAYIGSSGQTPLRLDQHSNPSQQTDTILYRAWKRSDQQVMVMLCDLPMGEQNERLRFAVELFFVVCFHAYPVWFVKDGQQQNAQLQVSTSVPTVSEILSTVFDHQYKRGEDHVITAMKPLLQTLGWEFSFLRKDFGVSQGLNMSTPLSTADAAGQRVVFMKTAVPGVLDQYRRGRIKAHEKSANVMRLGVFGKRSKQVPSPYSPRIDFTCSTLLDSHVPKGGDEVQLVFEIMRNNKPHPQSWARLTADQEMSDGDRARSLGIFVDRYDAVEGKHYRHYLQSSLKFNPPNQQLADNRPPRTYCMAIGIINSLEQKFFADGKRPGYIPFYGIQHVMELKMDNLTQVLHVNTCEPREIPPEDFATKVDFQSRIDRLKQAGGLGLGAGWQAFPTDTTSDPRPVWPGTCDRHLRENLYSYYKTQLEGTRYDHAIACRETADPAGKGNCTLCWDLCRSLCGWTPLNEDTQEYFKMIGPQQTALPNILTVEIPPPQYADVPLAGSSQPAAQTLSSQADIMTLHARSTSASQSSQFMQLPAHARSVSSVQSSPFRPLPAHTRLSTGVSPISFVPPPAQNRSSSDVRSNPFMPPPVRTGSVSFVPPPGQIRSTSGNQSGLFMPPPAHIGSSANVNAGPFLPPPSRTRPVSGAGLPTASRSDQTSASNSTEADLRASVLRSIDDAQSSLIRQQLSQGHTASLGQSPQSAQQPVQPGHATQQAGQPSFSGSPFARPGNDHGSGSSTDPDRRSSRR